MSSSIWPTTIFRSSRAMQTSEFSQLLLLPLKNNLTLFLSTIAICIVGLLLAFTKEKIKPWRYYRLPPGSLGRPFVGETIRFLRAFKANKIDEFIGERSLRYGPVFKTSLFGQPTVVFTGPEGNRFWLFNDGKLFHGNARGPHRAIIGTNSLLDKNGEEHRRMRTALMRFLSPDSHRELVGKIDSAVRRHLDDYWDGRDEVLAVPLLKFETFSVTCNVLFGLHDRDAVKELCDLFRVAMEGIYSFSVRFPGTRLHRALRARKHIDRILSGMIADRRRDLQLGRSKPEQDLISSLLSMTNKDDKPLLTDDELKDNIVLLIIAGHETTAMTLALMCKMLAANPHCYEEIARESREILHSEEQLRWKDLQRMKYLWTVAQETLRLIPPISGIFRKATTDIQYGDYTIPKGWALYWSNYSTVYRDEFYAEPRKFDPTRFEGSSGGPPPYCFLPFGGGPRMCPGNEYAKMEILVTMHNLVKRYRWTAQIPNEPIVRNPLCLPAMGLPLRLSPLQ